VNATCFLPSSACSERTAGDTSTYPPAILRTQLRQGRAGEWALERLATIGQACLAVLRNRLNDTLTLAIERLASDGWTCDWIKTHLELA